MLSDAIDISRISKIVGYKIDKGDFGPQNSNLPQRIGVFAEANTANQGTLDTTPTVITSAQQAGNLYGYGSPMHIISRILFPVNGGGIGSIPVVAYPQEAAVGSVAKVMTVTPVGTATKNGVHTVKVAGRGGIDGDSYEISIASGDTGAVIAGKIMDALNNVLACPFIATENSYETILTAKWTGLTSNDLTISVDTGADALGITYTVSNHTSGSGTPTSGVTSSLALIQSDWVTQVINSYGPVTAVLSAFEAFNGIANATTPTGRFVGIVMKPFVAITGDVSDNASAITDARLNEMTIAIAPAPLSAGLPMEAAANMAVLSARTCQDTPHLDVSGQVYPDMPTPTSIGTMNDYANRDAYVKKGCSTVELNAGVYKICDFVTTYHPVGETPPQFRYVRNIMLDMNIRYGYYLLEQINVVDHAIADDNTTVSVIKVVKPKGWKQVLSGYADDLGARGLIVDVPFMKASLTTGISSVNPDRFETTFSYKRSGFARQSATTAKAGFNFGTL